MPSLFGSLELGKKSLFAAQAGQTTTGHNIANVNTEGFSRQETEQSPSWITYDGYGTGVDIDGVRRIHDQFTKDKVVDETSYVGTWDVRTDIMRRAEIIYTDLEGNGLQGALNEFWSSWNSVSNEPEKKTLRKALISKGEKLSEQFRIIESRLKSLRVDINSEIESKMLKVNDLAERIAYLNKQIEQIEVRRMNANDLRDERDVLVEQVAKEIEIKFYENKQGNFQIQIGNGHYLVHGRNFNRLVTKHAEIGQEGSNDIALQVNTGHIYHLNDYVKRGAIKELVSLRDNIIKSHENNINNLARELVFNVNQIHATGTGIHGAKLREASAYSFDKEVLEKPIPFLKSGVFHLQLVNENEEIEEKFAIEIDAGKDRLSDIIHKINIATDAYETSSTGEIKLKKSPKLYAELNEYGSISIHANQGYKFIYGEDQTNFLGIIGLNSFFHVYKGVEDLEINPELVKDEMLISAGKDLTPGDNTIALDIAKLQYQLTMNDETATFDEYYNSQVLDIGLRLQRAQQGSESHNESLNQYKVIRDSISSVNLDEEMSKMIKYQRAYEASAKFMSTIDQMTETVINM